jgi:O-methyltransferase
MASTPRSSWLPTARHILRHPFGAVGDALIARHLANSLRYRPTERFGYEIAHRRDFFRHVFHYLSFNGIDGDYAEFGCHGAMTFRMAFGAAELTGHQAHLWAFDSFEGLPEGADTRDEHPQWMPGTMSTDAQKFVALCDEAGIPKRRYSVVPGFYSDTLVSSAGGERPSKIAFAYVDCDLYSSTTDVMGFLEARLRPGSVIGFDDYYCYSPEGPSGERLASKAHFAASEWTLVPFIQYGWHGMSFVVEPKSLGLSLDSAW